VHLTKEGGDLSHSLGISSPGDRQHTGPLFWELCCHQVNKVNTEHTVNTFA
jgi:hypothetical protein